MSEKKITYKDKMAVVTGYVSFFAGWVLVFINFVAPPLGTVADTTLWILAQSLLYCGGIVGIAQYTKGQISKIRHEVGLRNDEDEED